MLNEIQPQIKEMPTGLMLSNDPRVWSVIFSGVLILMDMAD